VINARKEEQDMKYKLKFLRKKRDHKNEKNKEDKATGIIELGDWRGYCLDRTSR
jgi:hypothetical protein